MTDRKISELTAITGGNVSDANDVLVIVDTDANTTKKITREELFKGVSGNVGIGISSPSASGTTLNVKGGSSTASIVTESLDGAGLISLYSGAGGSDLPSLIYSTTGLRFGSGAKDTAGYSERMRIDNSGNVGIGLTNPSFYSGKLTVAGNIAISGGNRALFWNSAGSGVASIEGAGTNELAFMTSGSYTERMRIDSSGNLLIGHATSGFYKLDVDTAGTAVASFTGITNAYSDFSDGTTILRLQTGGSAGALGTVGGHALLLRTNNTERMRIDSSGNVLVGATSAGAVNSVSLIPDGYIWAHNDSSTAGYFARSGSDGDVIEFRKAATAVGSISVTGSATSYNTTSDERLKKNIQDAGQSGETIDAIRVVQHDWKADGSHVDFGFIAQELNEVYPDAVTVPDDPEEMQSVDYSKLVPMLLKEIQDLRKRVSDLEEK